MLEGRRRGRLPETAPRDLWIERLDRMGSAAIAYALEETYERIAATGELPDEDSRALKRAVAIRNAGRAASSCAESIAEGTCTAHGHRFASRLYCGRPGCTCAALLDDRTGERGSTLARRWRRTVVKLHHAATWGYVVVTIPPELRDRFRSREGLAELHRITAAVAKVVRPDAPGSITCNHEFGDKSPKFLPHGNAVIPLPEGARGKVPKKRLQAARAALAAMLGIDERRANFKYRFVLEGRRDHLLRYVLRDTTYPWRGAISDEELYLVYGELSGFRRVRGHGKLADRNWKAFEATAEVQAGRALYAMHQPRERDALEANTCPCRGCASEVLWVRRKSADMAPVLVTPRPQLLSDGTLTEPDEPFWANEWKALDGRGDHYASLATWEEMQEADDGSAEVKPGSENGGTP